MTTRRAACSCGQLHLTIEGEPSRISMCHCLECQRRTGAAISNQARFRHEQVTFAGKSTAWMRTAESGNALTFHFCPTCGSTVYWEGEGFPGYVAVAIGNFADPNFPPRPSRCGRSHAIPGSPCRPKRRPSARRSRGELQSAVLCRVSVYLTDDPENRRVRSSLLHHNLGGRKMTVPPTLLARAAEIIE